MLKQAKVLFSQSAIYGLGNVLTQGIKFFLLPLYTQFLTPADYAILSVTSTFISVVNILLEFGSRGALTRFYYDFTEDEQERRSYYYTIWLFMIMVGLFLALLIDWQGKILFGVLFQDVAYIPYGRLALWISFVTGSAVIPLVLFRVREQALSFIMYTVGNFFLTTLLIIFFVVQLKQGAEGSLKGQFIAAILFTAPYTVITLCNIRPAFKWSHLKASLAFGLPLIPHQLSSWALNVSDRILLTHFVTLDELGLYSLGYRFGMILDMILSSINMAWSPFFYRTAANESDAPHTFARLTTYYTIVLLTMSLGISLLAQEVIIIMAKPAFHQAHKIVPVIVLAFVAHGFYFISVNQLFYAKQTQRLPIYTMLSAATNVGLNLLLLSRFGIMAAAWNTVIGYVILLGLVFRDSIRVYPIPYEYGRLTALLLVATVVYLAGSLVQMDSPYLTLAIKTLVIGLFPSALLIGRFFTPSELAGLRLVLSRLKHRLISMTKAYK